MQDLIEQCGCHVCQSIRNVKYAMGNGLHCCNNKLNNRILNLTPENTTQHSRIVTIAHKGSSTITK